VAPVTNSWWCWWWVVRCVCVCVVVWVWVFLCLCVFVCVCARVCVVCERELLRLRVGRMYLCGFVSVYVLVFVIRVQCICLCLSVHVSVFVCVCLCVGVLFGCLCVCIHAYATVLIFVLCVFLCPCARVSMCMCMFAHACARMRLWCAPWRNGPACLLADTAHGRSRELKESLDRALAIDPRDASSLHILGVWNYGISNLGWGARAFVRAVYGGLPAASFEEAARCLLAAAEISDAPPHHAELGKVYIAMGDTVRAREHLERCIRMPATFPMDADAQAVARELLSKC
jgi:hypothetical protein